MIAITTSNSMSVKPLLMVTNLLVLGGDGMIEL